MASRSRFRGWCASWCALAVLGAALAAPAPAAAWSGSGHMAIALLAFDALPRARRVALVELLEAHPRLGEDLLPALPSALSGSARDRWLFAVAATWPDLARGQPLYEHGTWHYVNLPLRLRAGQLVSCPQARRDFPESVRRAAEADAMRRARGQASLPTGDSIREALPRNMRTLADAAAPAAERALALSWVLHLVGDAHQPLHAVALFTDARFVTGDRGGNDILARDLGPLHRVWDDLLGVDLTPEALRASLLQLGGVQVAQAPAELASWLDRWLDEDCELARARVYTPEVLRAVQQLEANGAPPAAVAASASATALDPLAAPAKPEVALSPDYLRHGRQRARERARLAASRLASLLAGLRL
jgi:hypothetical protein